MKIADCNTGLTPIQISKLQKIFAQYPHIEKVILYGSRALGTYKPYSDIDLTCLGNQINGSELAQVAWEIDDLLLPYFIDLSIFHQLKNTDLIESIQKEGLVFYEKDKKTKP